MWTEKKLLNYLRHAGWLEADPKCKVPKGVKKMLPNIVKKINKSEAERK